MSQFPNYNLVPVETIIATVINLENLNLDVLNEIVLVKERRFLVSVIRLEKNYSKYFVFATNKLEADGDTPEFDFFSVQYSDQGVLVANTININVTQTNLSNLRSRMDVHYRSKNYNMYFMGPDLDDIREMKQAITSLYAFPNKAFVIGGDIVATFVFVKEYFVLTYLGEFNHSESTVIPYVNYDFANGTLIVQFGSQPHLIWNSETYNVVNLFPDVSYVPSGPESDDRLITGGANDYILTKKGAVIKSEILSRIVYSSQMNYPIDHLSGSLVEFIPLKNKIEVSPTEFILSFSNVLNETTKWKRYATLLKYTPFNTNYPFVTMDVEVTIVDDYDDTFTDANGIIFKFVDFNSILLVGCCGLPKALNANRANVTVADMIRWELDNDGINTDYNANLNLLNGMHTQQQQQAFDMTQQVQQKAWTAQQQVQQKGFGGARVAQQQIQQQQAQADFTGKMMKARDMKQQQKAALVASKRQQIQQQQVQQQVQYLNQAQEVIQIGYPNTQQQFMY